MFWIILRDSSNCTLKDYLFLNGSPLLYRILHAIYFEKFDSAFEIILDESSLTQGIDFWILYSTVEAISRDENGNWKFDTWFFRSNSLNLT